MDIEELYEQYCQRAEHNLLTSLLSVIGVFGVGVVVVQAAFLHVTDSPGLEVRTYFRFVFLARFSVSFRAVFTTLKVIYWIYSVFLA